MNASFANLFGEMPLVGCTIAVKCKLGNATRAAMPFLGTRSLYVVLSACARRKVLQFVLSHVTELDLQPTQPQTK